MGFIYETGSNLLGVERRRESCYLQDCSDGEPQMFFYHQPPSEIQREIALFFLSQAGVAYSRGDEKEAARLKSIGEAVKSVAITERRVAMVEVTKEWLRALYNFLQEHPEAMDAE